MEALHISFLIMATSSHQHQLFRDLSKMSAALTKSPSAQAQTLSAIGRMDESVIAPLVDLIQELRETAESAAEEEDAAKKASPKKKPPKIKKAVAIRVRI